MENNCAVSSKDIDVLPVNVNPNFCLIEILPRHIIREGIVVCLRDVFNAILNCSKITLDVMDLKYILQQDLHVKISRFPLEAIDIFLEAFLFYCKSWSGWGNTRNCLIENEALYENFCNYLHNKCIFIAKNFDLYHAVKIVDFKNANTQTVSTDFANQVCLYELIIGNEPIIINNVIRDEKPWIKLTTMEFLNWPHLDVEVELPDIHIKRVNTLNVHRCITLENKKSTLGVDFINHITSNSDTGSSYTHSFFSFYFNQFFSVIKKIPSINTHRVRELLLIFTLFLEDIKEINVAMGSMRTSTTVGFHIGNQVYYRAKQLVFAETPLNLIEYLVPQVDLTLNYFKVEQDLNDFGAASFKSLNAFNEKLLIPLEISVLEFLFRVNNTSVVYTCTYCDLKFSKSKALEDVMAHFAENHKVGNSVFCEKCGKEYEIKELVSKRWKHVCF